MLNWNYITGYVEKILYTLQKEMLTERMSVDQMLITVFLLCLNHLLIPLRVLMP